MSSVIPEMSLNGRAPSSTRDQHPVAVEAVRAMLIEVILLLPPDLDLFDALLGLLQPWISS